VELKAIIEAALLAAGRPLSLAELESLFSEHERPDPAEIHMALAALAEDCRDRPVELKQVASGYRLQVRAAFSPWVSRLFEERPGRYSRAFLETLAIIAYRQPVTRGEIEDIRGVAVSSSIVRALQERGWIHVVGHKEVPGRPALLVTTKQFLDYFNLRSLGELPPLQEFLDDLALQSAPKDQPMIENADHESTQ
jgi:segregation and condensation protein B